MEKIRDLKSHIKSLHEKEKVNKCNLCSYSTSNEGNLNGHTSFVHEGLKPQKRSFCEKKLCRDKEFV